MCCCKWCHHYLDSIYWHCFEKHFCFDMNIALYEDEDTIKANDCKDMDTQLQHPQQTSMLQTMAVNNNIYDNMAFYDNVAMIAKRSIFIIDPLDAEKQSIESMDRPQSSVSSGIECPITEQPKPKRISFPSEISTRSEPNLDLHVIQATPPLIRTNTTSLTSLATISEEHQPTLKLPVLEAPTVHVKMRKKSLHERRVSKSLTLDIDSKRQEVPITRQSSYPKFYMDTPEIGQNGQSTIGSSSIQALETPVVPNIFQFDLKTIVQLQTEKQLEMAEQERLRQELLQPPSSTHHPVTSLRRAVTSAKETRIQQIREKLKPIKLLRNASAQSLYSQKDFH